MMHECVHRRAERVQLERLFGSSRREVNDDLEPQDMFAVRPWAFVPLRSLCHRILNQQGYIESRVKSRRLTKIPTPQSSSPGCRLHTVLSSRRYWWW